MKKIFLILFLLFFIFPSNLYAQETEETFKGVVEEVFEVPCSEVLNDSYICFEYMVRIDETNESIRTSIPILSESGDSKFNLGDRVYATYITDGFDYESWAITSFVREAPILIMVLIFAISAILIGKRQGFGSLLSLAFTILILYGWAIPRILDGGDILLVGVITVCITLVVIMYVSHGFNKKSSIAVLSTLIGVLIVSILAKVFISMVRVDGSGSEEAFLLMSQVGSNLDLAAIFFISILIGAVGVLDDVVMSQVSSIQELHHANPTLSSRKLFSQAMNIGKDHLSSMVNTLFIAYAGSSFALVILLTYNSGGISNILRTDAIAEEIVRTLAASTGILLIVPITSFIASYLIPRQKLNSK